MRNIIQYAIEICNVLKKADPTTAESALAVSKELIAYKIRKRFEVSVVQEEEQSLVFEEILSRLDQQVAPDSLQLPVVQR